MPGWFDENGITGYEPVQQPQGRPGAEMGAALPQRSAQRFDLTGAQVHGRNADTKDANDLLWLASQQQGFDISSNDAAKQTFLNIIQPLFQQQGMNPTLGGRNLDRIVLPGGRTLDFIGNAANADTSKRRMWVGDSAAGGGSASAGGSLGSLGQLPTSPDLYRAPQGAPDGPTFSAPDLDAGAPFQMPPGDRPMMPPSFSPQTVQGPQAMQIPGLGRVPMFASGVQNFLGGPAIVGEKGPELLNLPKGSDVLPLSKIAAPMSFNEVGASLPTASQPERALPLPSGPMTAQPLVGNLFPSLPPGATPPPGYVDPASGQSAPGGPAGAPQGGPQAAQGGFQYDPMAPPQDYNPANIAGPDRLSLAAIGQPQAVNAQQVQGQTAQGGPAVQAGTVQTGDRVNAQQVTGPEALTARNVNDPTGFRDMTAAEYQDDPFNAVMQDRQMKAMQQSAAAKGLLRTGGTLKGLADYAGQNALAGMQQANERNRQTYQQNLGNEQSVIGQNNAAQAQAYGLTNQFGQAAQMANQQANLQAGTFNSGQQQQANLANVGNQLQAGQFNSAQQQQSGQFNAGQTQQAQLANQGANLQAGQFNAGMDFQTQQANRANELAAYNAYQPLAQQNSQFNAQQQAAAAQNNFANRFSVNQANNAGNLGAFNANLGAEIGRGNLELGNRQASDSAANAAGQLALGNRSADQSYDLGLRNNALGYYGAQTSRDIGLGNLGVSQGQLALGAQGQQYNQDANTFNTNYGIYRDNRDTAFNQDLALAGLGQNSAWNYGNAAGGYYQGQGAANGNAGMAGAGAWAGALGNIGNIAGQAGMYYGQPQGQQAAWNDPNAPIPWRG